MKKQTSIMWFFLWLGVAILVMALAIIGTMTYGLSVQARLQERFIRRTTAGDTILENLYEMERGFEAFSRDWSDEGYTRYEEICNRLIVSLEQYSSICQDAPVTQDYIRRLSNFNIYQMDRAKNAMSNLESLYTTVQYVDGGLNMHQQQALEMAKSDMLYARDQYETEFKDVSRWMFLIGGAFGLAALLTGGFLTRFFVVTEGTLNDMTEYFNRLAARDWKTPDLKESRYQEFTLIAQTVNRMKQEINQYIREVERQAKLEKQLNEERLINEQQHTMMISAQMSALRAQVNPHFLFNSLNLIGVTALMGNSENVMQLVEATGNILRYSLYQKEPTIPLDEELEIVRQYLYLQKCRFSDTVKTEIHNELEGEDIYIPTMSIQPIVENCFKHGFGNKKCLFIHISVTLVDNIAAVCVTDDGIGFLTEENTEKCDSGIGLNNIQKRLELMYGRERKWVEIESEAGVYSSVTVYIPQKGGDCESFDCGR